MPNISQIIAGGAVGWTVRFGGDRTGLAVVGVVRDVGLANFGKRVSKKSKEMASRRLHKAYQNQNIGWRWGATFVLKVNERGVATEVMREVGLATFVIW